MNLLIYIKQIYRTAKASSQLFYFPANFLNQTREILRIPSLENKILIVAHMYSKCF